MNAVIETKHAHANIYVALAAAQAEFSAPKKGAINPAFKSRYADLASVVEAVAPALTSHGIAFMHYVEARDLGTGLESCMVTALIHGITETRAECPVPLIVGKKDMQGFKSATTYAKRIGLESVTGVAPDDDDGNAASKAAPQRQDMRQEPAPVHPRANQLNPAQLAANSLSNAETLDALAAIWGDLPNSIKASTAVIDAKDRRKSVLSQPFNADLQDEIPY